MSDGMKRALAARRKKLAVSLGLVIGLPVLGLTAYLLAVNVPSWLDTGETTEIATATGLSAEPAEPIAVPAPDQQPAEPIAVPVQEEDERIAVPAPITEQAVIPAQIEVIEAEPVTEGPSVRSLLDEAEIALAMLEPVKALAHINSVLQIEPENQIAAELKAKAETLQRVQELLRQADKAEAEQDRDTLVASLSEIRRLDPRREGIQERLDYIKRQETRERFSKAIEDALFAVSERNLEEAIRAARRAYALEPDRPELDYVEKQINALATGLDLQDVQGEALDLVLDEDWEQAERVYEAGLARHPGDAELQEGLSLARSINAASAGLQDYLDRPHRLSDPAVAQRAREAATVAQPLLAQSSALAERHDKVLTAIDQMSVPMAVNITSDGQTHITVRGVGQVGLVEARTISLKPGRYLFEGHREGFRDVLIEVTLDPNQPTQTVNVSANEPL